MYEIVLYSRRPRQQLAASADAHPKFSLKRVQTWRQSILLSKTDHKVLVETYHTYHNILSFDAADDRQHKPGWMSANHNTTCFVFLHWYLAKLFFLHWYSTELRDCFGLQATSADARPNHHSKLGANQFLSPIITHSCPLRQLRPPHLRPQTPVNSCLEEILLSWYASMLDTSYCHKTSFTV